MNQTGGLRTLVCLYIESGPGELSAYAELFRDHHITGRRLFRLNGDDLLQIGIFAVGHRRDLLVSTYCM